MLNQTQIEKIIEIAENDPDMKIWEKSGKFRIYINSGSNSCGFITFNKNDITGRHSGTEHEMFYQANRPGHVSDLSYSIRLLTENLKSWEK